MILEKVGGRKASLKTLYYKALYKLGAYRQYSQPDWGQVKRLVYVCMGNINRSAYGEAKAKSLGMTSSSCGINADETKGASDEAIRNGDSRNIDLRAHHCKSIYNFGLQSGDLILAVEPAHLKAIEEILHAGNTQNPVPTQLTLLGLWATYPNPFLQDPICRSDTYFQACFDKIDQATCRINTETQLARATSGRQIAER
jgi:protein-tyrosine phosphatase